MPGRWNDDAEREDQYWRRTRRYDEFGLDDESDRAAADRQRGREDRSFDRGRDDRVFGQADYGVGYNRPRAGEGSRWQGPDYGGVSPAMRRGDYDTGYRANPRYSGGRYYGDDGRQRIYRSEAGVRGYGYGAEGQGYDAGRRSGGAQGDRTRDMDRYSGPRGVYDASDFAGYAGGTWSGGTGGYDYERGYGDAGRTEGYRGRDDYEPDRGGYEDRARDAGAFFRRTGRKISNWFDGLGREDDSDTAYRGARGLGPKGYKRSDERISEEAHQRLTDDPWVDASNVTVSVSGGEVTLSGTVENREAKHRAERIVEDLSGVNHVQNNLRIERGGYFTSAGRGYGDSVEAARLRNESTDTSGSASATNGDDAAARTARRS